MKNLETSFKKRRLDKNISKKLTPKKLKIYKSLIQGNDSNEICNLDDYDDSHVPIRLNKEIEADLLIKINAEVMTSFTYLTDVTINHVGNLINNYNNAFCVQNTIALTEEQDRIQPVDARNDIQFLFQKSDTPGIVGHWICIYYDHYQHYVYVYDSINSETLCRDHMNIIKRLYLNINRSEDLNIRFKSLVNQQKNGYSAAYGISLALGKDPPMINYKIFNSKQQDESKFLREHLLKII